MKRKSQLIVIKRIVLGIGFCERVHKLLLRIYCQFWEAYRPLFSIGLDAAGSEPVLRALLGLPDVEWPCGRKSIRSDVRGQIVPCVYWPNGSSDMKTTIDSARPGEELPNERAFQMARFEPSFASGCACRAGWAGHRAWNGRFWQSCISSWGCDGLCAETVFAYAWYSAYQ